MNTTDLSWAAYATAFGDAFSLLQRSGSRQQVYDALERSRKALDAVMDDMPMSVSSTYVDDTIARNAIAKLRANIDAIENEVRATKQ